MPWPKANAYHTSSPRVQMAFGVQWQQMIFPDVQGSSFQAALVPAAGAMDVANMLAAMAGAAAPARPAMPPTGLPAVPAMPALPAMPPILGKLLNLSRWFADLLPRERPRQRPRQSVLPRQRPRQSPRPRKSERLPRLARILSRQLQCRRPPLP